MKKVRTRGPAVELLFRKPTAQELSFPRATYLSTKMKNTKEPYIILTDTINSDVHSQIIHYKQTLERWKLKSNSCCWGLSWSFFFCYLFFFLLFFIPVYFNALFLVFFLMIFWLNKLLNPNKISKPQNLSVSNFLRLQLARGRNILQQFLWVYAAYKMGLSFLNKMGYNGGEILKWKNVLIIFRIIALNFGIDF